MKNKYTEQILDQFRNPRNVGRINGENAFSVIENPECGDLVRLSLKIDEKQIISDIKFQTRGCPVAIACSSVITEMAKGLKLEEAQKISKEDVAEKLGGLSESKMNCSNISADGLKLAIKNYNAEIGLNSEVSVENEVKQLITNDEKSDGDVDIVDLRGKECPMTFVYTKLALEGIKTGEKIRLIYDYPPAFTNVPNSVKKQDLGKIIDENQKDGIFELLIEKN